MKQNTILIAAMACLLCVGFVSMHVSAKPTLPAAGSGKQYTHPLLFTENRGQVADDKGNARPDILFTAYSGNTRVFLTATGIHYQFTHMVYPEGYDPKTLNDDDKSKALEKNIQKETYHFSLALKGANPQPVIRREGKNTMTENFYLPQYPDGITNVATYDRVVYENVYPNIDWVVYSKNNRLEYDFIVHPGGDPTQIKLAIKDADSVSITSAGELLMQTSLGEVREHAPVSYVNGAEVPTRFIQNTDGSIGFSVAAVPAGATLTIDPSVTWATYYGSTGYDAAIDCSVDKSGNIYMAGYTGSTTGIATMGGYQTTFGGSTYDGILVKFSASGTPLWATYYGGTGSDQGFNCAVDTAGNIYFSGQTTASTGLALNGYQNTNAGGQDCFLVKFTSSGTRIWATYFGGAAAEFTRGLTIDSRNNVYLSGETNSTSGIATAGAFQTVYATGASGATVYDAFVAKFNSNGNLRWATYYGGDRYETIAHVAVDNAGDVYLASITASDTGIASPGAYQTVNAGGATNYDLFLVKFDSTGANRLWGTYYGGSGDESIGGCGIDASGNIYVNGSTASTAGIATTGAYQATNAGGTDACLIKFSPSGTPLWGTYYGGSGAEYPGFDCAIDASNNIYITGYTASISGIATTGAIQAALGGSDDGFLAKFNSSGALQWGTYYGSTGLDLAQRCKVDNNSNVYLTGYTSSTTGIATPGAFQTVFGGVYDAFLVKINDTPPLSITTGTLANTVLCAGSTVKVPYSITGIFNTGNVFTAQLSDALGSFTGADSIGAKAGTAADTITATIPAGAIAGTGYRIRVISSNPTDIGSDNGTNLTIYAAVPTVTVNDTICASQLPYAWNGKTVTAAGTAVATDTLANIHGCDSVVTLNLTIKAIPQPAAFTDSSTSVCQGQTNVIYMVPNDTTVTYTWSYSGTGAAITGTTDSVSVSYNNTATSGTIQVTATNSCGVSIPRALAVAVNAIPVVSIAGNKVICTNSSTALIASGATTYSWSPSATLSSAIGDSVQAAPTATTTYTVTGTTGNCSDTVTTTVTVNALPKDTIIVYPPGVICLNSPLLLQTTIDTSYRYQWQLDGSNIPTANSAFFNASAAGNYDVIITAGSGVGCTITTHQVAISGSVAQPVIAYMGNGQLCAAGFASYQWYMNGTALPGDTTSCITVTTGGDFTVTVTNTAGCTATSPVYHLNTGVSNVTAAQVKLYPNPATSIVSISAPQNVSVSLSSIDGRELMHVENATTLNISTLPNAVYLIKVYDQDNNIIKVEKLVVSR